MFLTPFTSHLSQGDLQFTLQLNDKYYISTHIHTHNRSIQTTCWQHITLHVKLLPNALTHEHKPHSLRTTLTTVQLPHYLTTPNTRRGCRWLFDGCVLLGTTFYTTREKNSRYYSVRILWVSV